MPIETPAQGTLEVENAKFRASSLEATIAVGIGTESNTSYPLQVFKETAPDIRISEGSTLSSAARFYSNNSNLYIQTGADFTAGSSGDVAFQTMEGQTTHMVIKSDGKVGIGADSPLNILHLSSDNTTLDASDSATFDQYSLIIHNTRGTNSTNTELGLCFNHYDGSYPSGSRTPGAAITHERTAEWSKGKLHFKTKSGNTEDGSCDTRMTIDEVGNVGIGTTSPTDLLDVHYPTPSYGSFVGTEEGSLTVSSGAEYSNAAVYFRTPYNASAPAKMAIFSSGGGYSGYNGGLHFCLENTNNNTTKVDLNNSKMVVKADGNVGIGTTEPQDTLHIYGAPIIQHDTRRNINTAAWYKIGTWDVAASDGARLKISLLGGNGYNVGSRSRGGETIIYASINNNNNATLANIDGLVETHGDPVTTSVKFNQVGADRTKYEIHALIETFTQHSMSVECSGTTTFTKEWTASSDPGAESATVSHAIFSTVVDNSGNVGIGVVSPQAKLHVNGAITSSHYACFELAVTGYSTNDILEWKSDNDMISFNSGITLGTTEQINLNVAGIYLAIIKLNSDSSGTGKQVSIHAQYYDGASWRTNVSNSERSGDYDGGTEYHRSFMLNATSYTTWRFQVTHNIGTTINFASSRWSRLMISKVA